MGNRVTTVINGTTTYTTNNLNEYTRVGGAAYYYDADGNLLSDGTNTYTYNALNQLTGVDVVRAARRPTPIMPWGSAWLRRRTGRQLSPCSIR